MRKAALLVNNEFDEVERPARKSRGGPKQYSDPQQIGKPKQAANSKMHMSLNEIKPLTEAQRQMIAGFESGVAVTVGVGAAGTGKTILACYLALRELMEGRVESIKIIRSAVPIRSQGFLPGSQDSKNEVYESPYKDTINFLLNCGTAYETLVKKGAIEFMTTAFLRGLTFNSSIVVVDEIQNMDRGEILTILTRNGNSCRMIFCGDHKQSDLRGSESAYAYFMQLAKALPNDIDITNYMISDVVRSGFVRRLLQAEENLT